jgi:protease-4
MYGQFIQAVADGRKLDIQVVKDVADGRVFSGRDAKERSLIDATGDFQDAVDMTAKLAGITGRPTLIRNNRQRTTLLDVLTGDVTPLIPFGGKTLNSQIRFQYLWK